MSWIDDMNAMPEVAKVTQFQGKVKQNPAAVKKNKGNWATNLLPTMAGSTGGALAGAAVGATAGSVVPVVGTVAGGLLGALIGGASGGAGGKVLENKLEGNALGDGVGKEALISGVTSVGPGQLIKGAKLAKAGLGALKGSPAPTSLTSALAGTTDDVAQTATRVADEPLKASGRGRLLDLGNKALVSQYGTISKPVARATNPTKTIGELANYGVTKPVDVERISGAVTGSDGLINSAVIKAVGGANPVDVSKMSGFIDNTLKTSGLVDSGAKSTKNMIDAQVGLIDPSKPSTVLSAMKQLERDANELLGRGNTYHMATSADKRKATAIMKVRDKLQDELYEKAGANKNLAGVLTPEFREQLIKQQPNNPQWASFVDGKVMNAKSVKELRSTMAPFVKGRQIIDEGDLNSLTFGGRGGNLANQVSVGGMLNKVADVAGNVVKDPLARASSSVLRKAGGAGGIPPTGTGSQLQNALGAMGTTNKGKNAIGAGRIAGRNAVAQIADQAILEPDTAEADALSDQTIAEYNQMPEVDPNAPQFLEPEMTETAESDPNPFAPENATANIQKILANGGTMKDVTQYVSLVQAMQELQPKSEEQELNATAKQTLASNASGAGTLTQLEELYNAAGGGKGKLGGALANLSVKGGLNGSVQTYNDIAGSSVSQLAKAINGGGQVSDTDALVIEKALPRITDSPAVAREKFKRLQEKLANARRETIRYGAGSPEQIIQGVQ